MKKNLKTLITMGAIALSLTTGLVPTLAHITAHAEVVKDAAYYEHWAHDFSDAQDRNGIYVAPNVASKITMGKWTDDIRDIETGNTFYSHGYSIYKYTRNADGRIEVLNPEEEDNWKLRQADGWTLDEFVNDIIGEIEAYDNQYSHTYVPVTQKLVNGKGFMKTAHYDKMRTNNDPQKIYREFSQTNGIDTSIADPDVKSTSSSSHSGSSSSSGGSGSSGSGSSNRSKSSKSNSGSLTGWVSTSDGWIYQINGNNTIGWVNANGTWYFMNNAGIMQTGWVNTNGKWYYMNSNGSMATGWVNVSGKWYFLNSAGDMSTGWVLSNGKWYYLGGDGQMLSNTTVGSYRLDASGAWVQ